MKDKNNIEKQLDKQSKDIEILKKTINTLYQRITLLQKENVQTKDKLRRANYEINRLTKLIQKGG